MRFLCGVVLLSLALSFSSEAQTNTSSGDLTAKSPDEMKTILADTFKQNTFAYLPGPYHLIATFETFTPEGQPDGEGSIEKFFASPGHLKIITHFRDHTMTAYYSGGKPVYTDDGFDGTIMTYYANDFLLTPLPPPQGTAYRDIETKSLRMQGAVIDCGMFQFFIEPAGMPPSPKEALCVNRDTHDLALRETLHLSVRYRDFVPFLDRSIPRTISASQGPVVRLRIHVKQADQTMPDDTSMVPPSDASPVSPGPNWLATSKDEGTPSHRVSPSYPVDMKNARISGPAAVLVLISRTGNIKDVQPLYAPTPELLQAAVEAAKQWRYAPLIREGRPVETMTEIHMNFQIVHQ